VATPRNRQAIFELYVRPWLTDVARWLGRPLSLAEVPVGELDRIADLGLGWLWLMGVWPSGPRGIEIARTLPDLRAEYRRALPDFTDADVGGSPYAVAAYTVDARLGGPAALAFLRHRLAARGIRLMLDFVVNHTGIDHPWVFERPDLYVGGSEEDLERAPHDFFAAQTAAGRRVLAHGRDPYFPGWTDTAQLNLLHPETRRRLAHVLTSLAEQCDGARCDMAMLALGDVFRRTWGERALAGAPSPPPGEELWPELIAAARARNPGFLFLAEAYWGLEHALQRQGFDLTYDKALYERLRSGSGREVRDHLRADLGFQRRRLRFLENHDEPRAATAFPWDRHRAAAVIAATTPGALLIHNGQVEGNRVRLPVQLLRRPREETQPEVPAFYRALLAAADEIAAAAAEWRLLEVRPAWEGNLTWDGFVSFVWSDEGGGGFLAAVNFAPRQGQCYVALDGVPLGDGTIELRDRLSEARYLRPAAELASEGLYLDMPPFGAHLFALARA
jgi:glycosidase